MISVVIPLYNKERFVAATLDSVLGQTFTDFEVIVIDDGSTDDSAHIVQGYSDPRVSYVKTEHQGVSTARNLGIKKAQYDWIAFLDADDWWAPEFLAEMTLAMDQFSEVSLFASGRTRVFKGYEQRYANALLPETGQIGLINFYQIIKKHLPPINASNAVLSKQSILEAGGFHPHQKMHEDHDLWVRLCVNRQVVFVNKNLSFYRNTECDSASNQYYRPEDFCLYLQTLETVQKQLPAREGKDFKKYSQRFTMLTFIKYYSGYSRVEEQQVYTQAKKVVDGTAKWLLQFLKVFPYKRMYGFFKLFQR